MFLRKRALPLGTPDLITQQRKQANRWFFAFWALMAIFVLYVFIDKLTPVYPVVINEDNQLVGTYEYLTPDQRTQKQYTKGGKVFLSNFLAQNASTVYDDFSYAMGMMCEPLQQTYLKILSQQEYLKPISESGLNSHVVFDPAQRPNVERKGEQWQIRYQGHVVINGKPTENFDTSLTMVPVQTTDKNIHGIEVCSIDDN